MKNLSRTIRKCRIGISSAPGFSSNKEGLNIKSSITEYCNSNFMADNNLFALQIFKKATEPEIISIKIDIEVLNNELVLEHLDILIDSAVT